MSIRKYIKYFIWIIFILIIILIVNAIILSVKTGEYGFKIIQKENPEILTPFQDSIVKFIDFKTSFGNNHDHIYFYHYKDNINLIVWTINGFSAIRPADIKLFSNDNFNLINLNPMNQIELGTPTALIQSKTEYLNADEILIHVDDNYEMRTSEISRNYLFLDIASKGFALSDSKLDFKVKITFKEKVNYNLCFINHTDKFRMIMMFHKNKTEVESLYEMLIKDY